MFCKSLYKELKILEKDYVLPSEMKCLKDMIISKCMSFDKNFEYIPYITIRCDNWIYEYKSSGIGYKKYKVYKRSVR